MSGTLITGAGIIGVPDADTIRVESGRVSAVGTLAQLQRGYDRVVTHDGAHIGAALRDAHFHPVGYTAALNRLVVKNARDMADLADMIGAAAAQLPPGATLVGIRMDDEVLAERRLPDRTDLDRAAPDRPVILYRYCGHIASANTAALEAAGVGPDTPDPEGGSFDRDESGRPTGVLRETACNVVSRVIGDRVMGTTSEQLVETSRFMAATGLSAVGAMISPGRPLWADAVSELDVLLGAAPDLAVTMHTLLATSDPDELEAAAGRVAAAGPNARFLGVKMFSDGSLGGHTAAMDEPFSDRPGEIGTNRLTMEEALAAGRRSLALGGQVAIHAIGDRACAFVLDVFEVLLDEGAAPHDLRIEHASVLRQADIGRIADLGVIASVQPAFLASETEWLGKRLGDERLPRTYAFRSLLDAGARLAGGSDCPVEPPHPLHGVASAIDRGGIVTAEGLTNQEAWTLFTADAASALREPIPLSAQAPADLVVLDRDPLAVSAAELRGATVLATYRDGREGPRPDGPDWAG